MKKCPFCAEKIRDEAIKCRYCGSFLGTAPAPAPAPRAAASAAGAHAPAQAASGDAPRVRRLTLHAGSPSWRAFSRGYLLTMMATAAVSVAGDWVVRALEADTHARALAIGIPIALGLLVLLAIDIRRRARVIRVTTTSIETEVGVLSKRIDVVELWRCRDVRYRQSLRDRILGIAHIELFTEDTAVPRMTIMGMPASRQVFENIRDAIEDARQARAGTERGQV